MQKHCKTETEQMNHRNYIHKSSFQEEQSSEKSVAKDIVKAALPTTTGITFGIHTT